MQPAAESERVSQLEAAASAASWSEHTTGSAVFQKNDGTGGLLVLFPELFQITVLRATNMISLGFEVTNITEIQAEELLEARISQRML